MNISQYISSQKLKYPAIYVDVHSHHQAAKENVLCLVNKRVGYDDLNLKENQFYSLGVHPWDLKPLENVMAHLEQLIQFAKKEQVLAIGETGFDRSYKNSLEEQRLAFYGHLELARVLKKPLILHAVRSHSDILEVLKKEQWSKTGIPLIHHDFRGGLETVKNYSPYDCAFSFGTSLWKDGEHIEVFKSMQLSQLFLETDDQILYGVEEIYTKAAELKGVSLDSLKEAMLQNFRRFFVLSH